MTEAQALEQFTKELQAFLEAAVNNAAVYEGDAPRNNDGVVSTNPPFVVYTFNIRSPQDEKCEYNIDLFLDVWALNSWANCYREAMLLDAALNGTVNAASSGVLFCDQNGQVMQRQPKDPDDERIRRMSSQYLIRFYPNL